jgi:magnesium chelatase family protein
MKATKVTIETAEVNWTEPPTKHLHEIIGNEAAKRAIEVALVGGHNIAFLSTVGSPASDLLKATARLAKELDVPFKGKVIPVCPCGGYGNPKVECTCSANELNGYARKVFPFFREADVIIETTVPLARETTHSNEPESRLGDRVALARARKRPSDFTGVDAETLLRTAISNLGGDRTKILAVAASIATLDGSQNIAAHHVAEAIQYQHPASRRAFDVFEEVTT